VDRAWLESSGQHFYREDAKKGKGKEEENIAGFSGDRINCSICGLLVFLPSRLRGKKSAAGFTRAWAA
jgi:hypothetical protein